MWQRTVCAIACLSLVGLPASAQQGQKQKTPRALALVEWPAKGEPVVVPIAIRINGHFYDASIYLADPVPMALDYGNVYEVEKSGDPVGFVTLDAARESNGRWIAAAKYQTREAVLAASTRKAPPPVRRDPEEGPPKLTRSDEKKSAPESKPSSVPAQTKPQTSDSGDGPPRLHKPADTKPAAAPDQPQSTVPAPGAAAEPQDADLSGRPRLRRGKPVQSVESAPAPEAARISTATTGASNKETHSGGPVRILPAISDEGGPEPTSFLMPGSTSTPAAMVSGMEDLARAALQKYADAHGGAQVGALEGADVRAFDLSLVSQATVVLTASAHPAPPRQEPKTRRGSRTATPAAAPVDPSLTFWITVVARENYNGDLRPLKVWATDDKHLDAYPRVELIDAVDADGDGRGELLFRQINDLGRSFLIARAGVDQLVTLYDSGQLTQ